MPAGSRKRVVVAMAVAAVLLLLGWGAWRFTTGQSPPQERPIAGPLQRPGPRAPITTRSMGPGTALLSWDRPDPQQLQSVGSLDRVAGYRIYVGPRPDALKLEAQLADPRATRYVVRQLPPGTSWFTVTTYTRLGMESDQPAPVSKQID